MTDYLLLEYRIQHTLHSSFHILDCIVDNLVETDIYTLIICSNLGNRIRTNVKSNDDCIGSGCKDNIGLVDCTNTTVDYLNNNFFVGQFYKRLLDCLNRTLNVSLNDEVKFLHITGLDL